MYTITLVKRTEDGIDIKMGTKLYKTIDDILMDIKGINGSLVPLGTFQDGLWAHDFSCKATDLMVVQHRTALSGDHMLISGDNLYLLNEVNYDHNTWVDKMELRRRYRMENEMNIELLNRVVEKVTSDEVMPSWRKIQTAPDMYRAKYVAPVPKESGLNQPGRSYMIDIGEHNLHIYSSDDVVDIKFGAYHNESLIIKDLYSKVVRYICKQNEAAKLSALRRAMADFE